MECVDNVLVTDRIRSMAEGTVFTGVCHSFCPQGGGVGGVSEGEGGGGFAYSPSSQDMRDMVNWRSLRILLECILVLSCGIV